MCVSVCSVDVCVYVCSYCGLSSLLQRDMEPEPSRGTERPTAVRRLGTHGPAAGKNYNSQQHPLCLTHTPYPNVTPIWQTMSSYNVFLN